MFTIIIPTYNNENIIHRSISSILLQTEVDYEVIIVNDGSTDNTLEVLESINDERVKVITQQNQGVSVARNTGILNASNSWICFLDADDEWLPCHLELLKKLIKSYPDKNAFGTSYYTQYVDGFRKAANELYPLITDTICINNLFSIISSGNTTPIFNTNSMCINKSIFESCGMFEVGVDIGEDTDMWNRIAINNDFVFSPIPTSVYHREASTATQIHRYNFEWPFEKRCKTYINDNEISREKKQSLTQYYNLLLIRKCRQYLLIGNRINAKKVLSSIIPPIIQQKYYWITVFCFFLPTKLLYKITEVKNRRYYRS